MLLPIRVTLGTIEIEAISGVVREDYFLLYVSLREKYAETEAVCEGLVNLVAIWATEKTLRATRGGEEYEKIDLAKERPTEIEVGGNWSIEASCSRYTCRIIGVRTPETGDIKAKLSYEIVEKAGGEV